MHPILFSLGPFHIYSYGLCLALAFVVSLSLLARDISRYIGPKMGLKPQQGFQLTFELGTWVILGSLLGARIFFVWENHFLFEGGLWLDAFKIWQGGLVFYGGLIGGVLTGIFWARKQKWPLAYLLDISAPYILLGHAFGRVGCYLNGCCYGAVDFKHGMVFPGGEDQFPHLPTQLWELYGDLVLFSLLLWSRKFTIKYSYLTFSLYVLTYGVLRYIIEFWRRDWNKQYLGYFVSASQAVSALTIFLAITAILWIFFGSLKFDHHLETNKDTSKEKT
ncbi:MAG TPA: prolipoprotein diacylglyceryl transferase [bacterium]